MKVWPAVAPPEGWEAFSILPRGSLAPLALPGWQKCRPASPVSAASCGFLCALLCPSPLFINPAATLDQGSPTAARPHLSQ